jgi:ribulose bisphosphate carboxylase small subunit
MQSTLPASLLILVVIVVLAAGYFSGREYVNSRRFNRRNWK